MFFADLEPFDYMLPRPIPGVQAVGWLSAQKEFVHGTVPSWFLAKLLAIAARESVSVTRGVHRCEFCNHAEIWYDFPNKKVRLGSSEIWIPSGSNQTVYAAPDLILHYCSTHAYRPPDVFIDAVSDFNADSAWSGEDLRSQRVAELFTHLNRGTQ
jgi:hypothetical protein